MQNMLSAPLPDMLRVLLTANCAEYVECTVTGKCYGCSLLPTVQNMLSAPLPENVTDAPYCQLCRIC